MSMSITTYILPEKESCVDKMLHHEERSKYSLDNLSNFTNPLDSKIQSGKDTFAFKGSTSQTDRLEFLESTRKEIGAPEDDKHWTIVRRIELNGNMTIM